jgi:hypothetical protein
VKHIFRIGVVAVVAIAATAAVIQSCGGGGSSTTPSGDATVIDLTSATKGIAEVSTIIPVCKPGAGLQGAPAVDPASPRAPWLGRLVALRRDRSLGPAIPPVSLGSTPPADQFGDCGGRITYPVYSHSNGVTTGTFQFDNYCTTDTDTGEKQTSNGRIDFVNTGTPSNSGPITTKVTASSPAGVTFVVRSAAGAQLSSQKVTFSDYLYNVGVPGGTPTASNPNRLSLGDATLTDQLTGKSYRQSNYSVTAYQSTAGGDNVTISGRSYRSNGEYFSMNTTTPLVTNSSGDFVSGTMTFTGANASTAVLTMVPGSTLQATMTVNGQPVTAVPVCR